MKIKYLDFGTPYKPKRSYDYDAGMDISIPYTLDIVPNETVRIPLGFGLEVPAMYAGFVIMRSSMASKGLVSGYSAIDTTYNGEISVIISNVSKTTFHINEGDRLCSLILTPVVIFDWADEINTRRDNRTGSTGVGGDATTHIEDNNLQIPPEDIKGDIIPGKKKGLQKIERYK